MTYGVHKQAGASQSAEHPPAWAEDDLSGWQLLMTDVGCFTGLTALEVHGVPLPPLPEECPVFVALAKDDPRPMRSGVHTSRHIRPVEHVVVRGLRVATVPEALTAAARWLGVVDIVALIDAAIFLELVSLEQLEVIARTRRPGGRRLRAALPLVDGRAQSLWESLLRLLHVVCGIEVEPQWELVDADGVLVAQPTTSGNNPRCATIEASSTRDFWSDEMTEQVETTERRTDQINLSAVAASKINSLLEQEGRDDLALRISVQPGGCSGLRYQLFFDERTLDGDVTTDFDGVTVVVDRMSVPYLNGAEIDFVDTIEKQGFTIDNPNATGSCACGDSFH